MRLATPARRLSRGSRPEPKDSTGGDAAWSASPSAFLSRLSQWPAFLMKSRSE